jgi:hypothetical protein
MSVNLMEQTSMNWLDGKHDLAKETDRPMEMPVFAGRN